ncbi:hypothetical protein OQA88_5161 [Cercophora sp. LCS_1]
MAAPLVPWRDPTVPRPRNDTTALAERAMARAAVRWRPPGYTPYRPSYTPPGPTTRLLELAPCREAGQNMTLIKRDDKARAIAIAEQAEQEPSTLPRRQGPIRLTYFVDGSCDMNEDDKALRLGGYAVSVLPAGSPDRQLPRASVTTRGWALAGPCRESNLAEAMGLCEALAQADEAVHRHVCDGNTVEGGVVRVFNDCWGVMRLVDKHMCNGTDDAGQRHHAMMRPVLDRIAVLLSWLEEMGIWVEFHWAPRNEVVMLARADAASRKAREEVGWAR